MMETFGTMCTSFPARVPGAKVSIRDRRSAGDGLQTPSPVEQQTRSALIEATRDSGNTGALLKSGNYRGFFCINT